MSAPMTDAGRFTRVVLLFYTAGLVLTLGVAWLCGISLPSVWSGAAADERWNLGLAAAAGLLVGGLLLGASELLERTSAAARRLSSRLGEEVPRLSVRQAALCAVSSSVAEEALFRGVLQPLWGLGATAAAFGLCHGGFTRDLRLWALLAVLGGLVLGALCQVTGSLAAPIVAHATLNAVGLRRLGQLT